MASEAAADNGLEIIFGGIGGDDSDFSEGDGGTGAKFSVLFRWPAGRPLEAATEVFTVIIEKIFHFYFGHFFPLKSCKSDPTHLQLLRG